MSVKLEAIPVVYFEEGAVIIAHCVPLDVSSCGHDLQEARRNIRDAVAGFIDTCEEMGTLEEVLEKSALSPFKTHQPAKTIRVPNRVD